MTAARTSLTLHEAADRLGVHYMTVYRWVRLGRLPAQKVDGGWVVDPTDLERARSNTRAPGRRAAGGPERTATWRSRLENRMLTGDVAGSWGVVEAAMAAGLEPRDVYVEVVGPILRDIGDAWRSGSLGIQQEHLASGVATTIIGRLGPRFGRRGRKRGVVLLAMPPGERHGLGVAMLADILSDGGYEVRNLGPDTPPDSLVAALRDVDRPAAVIVSVVDERHRPAALRLARAARRERPSVPLLVGGHAVPDEATSRALGSDGWVADPRDLADLIATLGRPGRDRTSRPADPGEGSSPST
jgi:excisionase family DNA binding protein